MTNVSGSYAAMNLAGPKSARNPEQADRRRFVDGHNAVPRRS